MMAVGDHEPRFDLALSYSSIILKSAKRLSETTCDVTVPILTNKKDGFWLKIIIGMSPYNENQFVWERIVGGSRERCYAHAFKIRIPFALVKTMEDVTKLQEIGRSLVDVWWESRHLPSIRTDRRYILPHINT